MVRHLSIWIMPVLIAVPAVSGDTVYVNASASGANDGTSWENAYVDLQDALAIAVNGDEVWVAKGRYVPAGKNGPRTSTFQLPSGVTVYGGFAGGEQSSAERTILSNPTVLSGDLNGDDSPGFANNSENVYHVVTWSKSQGATIDGFVVSGGNANGVDHSTGAGILEVTDSALYVRNCLVEWNASAGEGGGIWGGGLVIEDCEFRRNRSDRQGGAAHIGGGATIERCRFADNTAISGGGALRLTEGGSISVRRCEFGGNGSTENGGAVRTGAGSSSWADCLLVNNSSNQGGWFNESENVTVANCTFVKTSEVSAGYFQRPTIANCIFWQCTIKDGMAIYRNCTFNDPAFVDEAGGDFRLRWTSACIDGGYDGAVQEGVDLMGEPRKVDAPCFPNTDGVVDIGAYEWQNEPCYANCDENCALDLFDYLCFVNRFNVGDDQADCDGSDGLDLFDFLCFVNAFNAGC